MKGNYPLIDTIGIEFESLYTHENTPPTHGVKEFLNNSHDASIQTDMHNLLGGRVFGNINNKEFKGMMLNRNMVTVGNELVTVPIHDKVILQKVVKRITNNLFEAGETTKGPREALHIHVCFPFNLEILKRILNVSLVLENFFFNIGCLGYEFRGLKNNSIYCRPFSEFGPPVILNNSIPRQVLNVDNLLEAQTIESFWNLYGNIGMGGNNRYHPARYFYVNLYSLLLHDTLEFRVFNKTLDSNRILALVELCQGICKIVLDEHKYNFICSLGKRSIFTITDINTNLNVLNALDSVLNFSDNTLKILKDIIIYSPPFKLESAYVYTHVKKFLEHGNRVLDSRHSSPDLSEFTILETKVEDIHNLRDNNRNNDDFDGFNDRPFKPRKRPNFDEKLQDGLDIGDLPPDIRQRLYMDDDGNIRIKAKRVGEN